MPPERFPPDDPREWINRARSNLLRAADQTPGIYLEDLCFDAQQAAEKAIKAVCIVRDVAFPYTHNLSDLLTSLEADGEDIPVAIWEVAPLTVFASTTRYPGQAKPVTSDEHARAVKLAEAVVVWAEQRILGT